MRPCNRRSWAGWTIVFLIDDEDLIPDSTSRSTQGMGGQEDPGMYHDPGQGGMDPNGGMDPMMYPRKLRDGPDDASSSPTRRLQGTEVFADYELRGAFKGFYFHTRITNCGGLSRF